MIYVFGSELNWLTRDGGFPLLDIICNDDNFLENYIFTNKGRMVWAMTSSRQLADEQFNMPSIPFSLINNFSDANDFRFRVEIESLGVSSSTTISFGISGFIGNSTVCTNTGRVELGLGHGGINLSTSLAGSISVTGTATVNASLVTYQKGEDVPEWATF